MLYEVITQVAVRNGPGLVIDVLLVAAGLFVKSVQGAHTISYNFV